MMSIFSDSMMMAGRVGARLAQSNTPIFRSAATTHTFSANSIGSAAADRLVVVRAVALDSNFVTSGIIQSISIGGSVVSSTDSLYTQAAVNTGGVNYRTTAGIAFALVPAGTTTDVVVVLQRSMRCVMKLDVIVGGGQLDKQSAAADAAVSNINLPNLYEAQPGVSLAVAVCGNTRDIAWTGTTSFEEVDLTGGGTGGFAYREATSNGLASIAASWTTNAGSASVAGMSWG